MAIGNTQEILVTLEGNPQLAARLNAGLRVALASKEVRVASPLDFIAHEGALLANPELHGDDADLATYLRALQQLSAEHPDRTFRVDCGDGPVLRLARGSFGKHDRRVASFLERADAKGGPDYAVPAFTRVSLTVPGTEGRAFRKEVVRSFAMSGTLPELAVAETARDLTVSAVLDGTARQTERVLAHFSMAWMSAAKSDQRPPSVFRLEGPHPRVHEVAWTKDWVEVRSR